MLNDLHELRDEELGIHCPLQREFTEEEWQAFLKCARHGFASCGRIHKEFTAKIEDHFLSENEIERALQERSMLVSYENHGLPRIGLWDPVQGIFIVGTVPAGLFLTAFRVKDFGGYITRRESVLWLRK